MSATGGADTGPSSLGNRSALVTSLRGQVRFLEADLRERSDDVDRYRDRLRTDYARDRETGRTGDTYSAWRDERLTQVAVSWVLATVFVRFCEDNGLVDGPFIAGPGTRLAEALERQAAHRAQYAGADDRDWLVETLARLERSHPEMARVLHRTRTSQGGIFPSPRAAARLLAFWRQTGEDGSLRFDLTDPDLGTDFLGELYQDISESARKAYALVRTPGFVTDFVLDRTADPALARFGPRGFRGIDPVCGSGAFLLGLFERVLGAWRSAEPLTWDDELVRRSLASVHGCDVNPFAVDITRFRLLIAAVRAGGRRSLDRLQPFEVNVAQGDALLEGRGGPRTAPWPLFAEWEAEEDGSDRAEDGVDHFSASCDLLGRNSYHVVVGEPPFTIVRDKIKSMAYREAYDVVSGAPSVPVLFTVRMFQLAVRGEGETSGGYVGQYTSSSFTRRSFGRKLVADFLSQVELTHVIDTSGVYVPDHSTPTLILIGRNSPPTGDTPVRSVLGGHTEPKRPADPADGIVWKSIVDQVDRPGSASEWVTVQDEPRQHFTRFPWTLTGRGAELMDRLEWAPRRLGDVLSGPVRVLADPGERDAFAFGRPWFARHPDAAGLRVGMVTGDSVRNWRAEASADVLAPYSGDGELLPLDPGTSWSRLLWTVRQVLRTAPQSSGAVRSTPWWAWRRWPSGDRPDPVITFAQVATHNHFALAHGARVPGRTAPVLRLPTTADRDDHLSLLGLLNSSAVCFWLKQNGNPVGADGRSVTSPGEEWARAYGFTPASLRGLPLPADGPLFRARALHSAGQRLDTLDPRVVCADGTSLNRARLNSVRALREHVHGQMVALQEELDWEVYASYGLLTAEATGLTMPPGLEPPSLRPGERAFEIVLARRMAAGTASDSWFVRNDATPVTEVPAHWPTSYQALVRARIDAIERDHVIATVERPEYKRRWVSESWARTEERALRSWLLDRCEDERLWFGRRDEASRPRARTIDGLARDLGADSGVRSVAALYATDHLGRPEAALQEVLAAVLADECLPDVSALTYRESGLRKRAQWEQVWELQRREDETGVALGIPVPPKFTAIDFRRASYWSLRGKLDLPRERFLCYPDGVPSDEGGSLIGWSGWSDADRVRVLLDLIDASRRQPGPGSQRVMPLLAGIQERLPWVRQWEAQEQTPRHSSRSSAALQAEFDRLRAAYGVSVDDLASWRPRSTTTKSR
ncbi:BREX-2 system adenine-specific DNA-methyltransferase PglX [Streptomyces sp. NPDC012950]|uniref:BREX-2 system adenine-specific DNA-methyltransferase PglX n=1 Tax=Streptomyces sp. NPDC012950 TaxID=3364858 RepID=UPI0036AB1591